MRLTQADLIAERKLWGVLQDFSIAGSPMELTRIYRGNIHDSYVSIWQENPRRYLHQLVNQTVFPNVEGLMSNIATVTTHIQSRLDTGICEDGEKTLSIVPSRGGNLGVLDAEGGYWRTYEYISDTRSLDVCDGPQHAREAARMFGRFLLHCMDLDPKGLHETIPLFQNTPYRYEQLEEAVGHDRAGRCCEVSEEIEFAKSRESLGQIIVESIASGKLPTRVIHYDTKLNNILFDVTIDRGVCVVDLDTVMPGTTLYDFGDLVRNAAVPAAEDERDLSRVQIDLRLFEALVRGYLDGTEGLLEPNEIELMAIAPRVLALTLGVRFLTDYINGDRYFNIRFPEHNLVRCRTQFEIVRSMESFEKEMRRLVFELAR